MVPTGESSLTASLQASSDAKEKGAFISDLLQTHFTTLVEEISPADTAQQLYNLALLTIDELQRASNPHMDRTGRSQAIVYYLKKKLRYQPELFCDVCAALKKAGVKVIEEIKGIV